MSSIGGFNALITTISFMIFGKAIRNDWIQNLSRKIRRDLIKENSDPYAEIPSR
jgi:hypothetical protein